MLLDGIRVVDAKRPLSVTITDKDIRLGTKDPTECAAARACKRQLQATEARVYIGVTYIHMGNRWVRYHTPPSLRTEIIAFDRGAGFEPGEYQFKPVRHSHKLGVRQGTSSPRRNTKRRQSPHFVSGIRHFAVPRSA